MAEPAAAAPLAVDVGGFSVSLPVLAAVFVAFALGMVTGLARRRRPREPVPAEPSSASPPAEEPAASDRPAPPPPPPAARPEPPPVTLPPAPPPAPPPPPPSRPAEPPPAAELPPPTADDEPAPAAEPPPPAADDEPAPAAEPPPPAAEDEPAPAAEPPPPAAEDEPVPAAEPPPPAADEPAPLDPAVVDRLRARRAAPAAPWPENGDAWTCEIRWKPGYAKSRFRAMATPPGGKRPKPIAESAVLRWTLMMDAEMPTPDLVEAQQELVERLESEGWTRAEPGAAWYAERYVWTQGSPPRT